MLTASMHESNDNCSAQKRIQWQTDSFCVVHLPLDLYVEVLSCSHDTLTVLLQREMKTASGWQVETIQAPLTHMPFRWQEHPGFDASK